MQKNKDTRKTASGNKKNTDMEKAQANTQSEIREGQEDSSILYDDNEGKSELPKPIEEDISSTSQEEFIEDRNTKKEKDNE